MVSVLEDKLHRILMMTRKVIYMSRIVYLTFVDLLPILLSCMNCISLLCLLHSYEDFTMHLLFYCVVLNCTVMIIL